MLVFSLAASAGAAFGTTVTLAESHIVVQHRSVSTHDQAAQRLFDEALTLVYAFNRNEATVRFQKAAAIDPRLAMAWWGIALAQGPNINFPMESARVSVAMKALARARDLESGAAPRERALIDALRTRYSVSPRISRATLDKAYMIAMKGVTSKDPADLDAATLYAESILDVAGGDRLYDGRGRAGRLTPSLVATLHAVLQRDPSHIGACHYYIHALDASGQPDRARACASRLSSLSFEPAASHLTHMGSHIWMQTGDFANMQRDGERSVREDEAFARSGGVAPATLDYYDHNLDFWAGAAIMRGRFADYDRIVKRFGKRFFPLYYLARLGRWNAILATPDPTAGKPAARFSGLAWHYARCLAFAARPEPARAAKERDAYAAIERSFPADERAYFKVERDVLDAFVADAGGNRTRSITRLEDALSVTDAQPADNYPNWRFPLREWLGKEYLRRGDALSAARVFRADLARDHGNGRSLFGLMLALRAQKSGAAPIVEREYRAAWRDADAPLTASPF